jgi:hypothetical protein
MIRGVQNTLHFYWDANICQDVRRPKEERGRRKKYASKKEAE